MGEGLIQAGQGLDQALLQPIEPGFSGAQHLQALLVLERRSPVQAPLPPVASFQAATGLQQLGFAEGVQHGGPASVVVRAVSVAEALQHPAQELQLPLRRQRQIQQPLQREPNAEPRPAIRWSMPHRFYTLHRALLHQEGPRRRPIPSL